MQRGSPPDISLSAPGAGWYKDVFGRLQFFCRGRVQLEGDASEELVALPALLYLMDATRVRVAERAQDVTLRELDRMQPFRYLLDDAGRKELGQWVAACLARQAQAALVPVAVPAVPAPAAAASPAVPGGRRGGPARAASSVMDYFG